MVEAWLNPDGSKHYTPESILYFKDFIYPILVNHKQMRVENNLDKITTKIRSYGCNDFIIYPLNGSELYEARFKTTYNRDLFEFYYEGVPNG